jgi:hypothetical protein
LKIVSQIHPVSTEKMIRRNSSSQSPQEYLQEHLAQRSNLQQMNSQQMNSQQSRPIVQVRLRETIPEKESKTESLLQKKPEQQGKPRKSNLLKLFSILLVITLALLLVRNRLLENQEINTIILPKLGEKIVSISEKIVSISEISQRIGSISRKIFIISEKIASGSQMIEDNSKLDFVKESKVCDRIFDAIDRNRLAALIEKEKVLKKAEQEQEAKRRHFSLTQEKHNGQKLVSKQLEEKSNLLQLEKSRLDEQITEEKSKLKFYNHFLDNNKMKKTDVPDFISSQEGELKKLRKYLDDISDIDSSDIFNVGVIMPNSLDMGDYQFLMKFKEANKQRTLKEVEIVKNKIKNLEDFINSFSADSLPHDTKDEEMISSVMNRVIEHARVCNERIKEINQQDKFNQISQKQTLDELFQSNVWVNQYSLDLDDAKRFLLPSSSDSRGNFENLNNEIAEARKNAEEKQNEFDQCLEKKKSRVKESDEFFAFLSSVEPLLLVLDQAINSSSLHF